MPQKPRRQNKRRLLRADDLFNVRLPIAIAMSPNERAVAYTVEWMDQKENKYFSNIHICDLGTRQSRQFTHGNHKDGAPVWSPDGAHIAFLSTRDKKTGIYLMPTAGGAERRLLEVDGTVSGLQWTPSSKELVFALRYNDSHFIEDENKKKEPPVFRHITRLWYRADGLGFLPKDVFQICALDVMTARLRRLTRGRRDNLQPHVSPDGRLVVYISNRDPQPYVNMMHLDLFTVPMRGGRERRIATPKGPVYGPRFSPDGGSIAYIGHDRPRDMWGVANLHVWKVGVSGRPRARDLMPDFDRSAVDLSITDTADVSESLGLTWTADGKHLLFLASDTGATNLFSVPSRGGKPTRIFKGKCHLKRFSVAGSTRLAAVVHADLQNPGEIVVCPTTYGAESRARKLTSLNRFLSKDVRLSHTREVWFKGYDGTRIQGWLVTPPDFKPGRKHPAILEIHGGPRVQYAFTFFHEIQWLAAQGFVVLYTNPRGGAGRGETWAAAIQGGWGDLDYQDCLAAADFLEKQRFVNRKRIGVTGGSYGGYMTNWIIGHTDRFQAAVTQRSVVDLRSFVGSTDMGFSLDKEFNGYPWSNPENYVKCSPITYFRNVKTPVLILHNEMDLRSNIEQAEQMFAMLKILGKRVELVRFPEEPHGLSRHGRPDRRVARLEWICRWFKKHL